MNVFDAGTAWHGTAWHVLMAFLTKTRAGKTLLAQLMDFLDSSLSSPFSSPLFSFCSLLSLYTPHRIHHSWLGGVCFFLLCITAGQSVVGDHWGFFLLLLSIALTAAFRKATLFFFGNHIPPYLIKSWCFFFFSLLIQFFPAYLVVLVCSYLTDLN